MKIILRLVMNAISLGVVLFGLAAMLANEAAFGIGAALIGLIGLTLSTRYISISHRLGSKLYQFLRMTEIYVSAGVVGVISGAIMTMVVTPFIHDAFWLQTYMIFVVNISIIGSVSFGYYVANRKGNY